MAHGHARSNIIRSVAMVLGAALSLQGCTTHLVTRGDPGSGLYTEGLPYRLPINQFKIDVTWQISSCKPVPGPTQALNSIEVGFKQMAEIKSEMGEGEALVIDYRQMTGPFKTGKLDVDYWTIGEGKDARPTTLVKSINSEIEGQEAEAIKAAAGAIGSIAKLALTASGVPLPAGGTGGAVKAPVACNDDVLAAISQLDGNEATLKGITKKIEKLTLQITLISGRVVGGKLTAADDKRLGEIQTEMGELNDQKENLTESTKKLKAYLTYRQSYPIGEFDWPKMPAGSVTKLTKDLVADPGKLGELALKAVDFDDTWCKLTADNIKTCNAIRTSLAGKANSSKVVASLDARGFGITGFTPAFSRMSSDQLRSTSFNGFVYREPVPARVAITDESGEMISELITTAPQYGRVRVLPLRSRFAEKNGLSAQFAQNGMPTKTTYSAYEAGGTAAIQSVGSLLDQANIVADRIAADVKAKAEKVDGAELQAVKDKIALLTEQQKLATLEKAPDAEIAARDTELARLRYEVERMELLAKLDKAAP